MSMRVARVDLGAHVVVAVRDVGERRVRRPSSARRAASLRMRSAVAADLVDERVEELGLALERSVLGVRDAVLQLVELVVRVALAAGHGLLAAKRRGRLAGWVGVTSMYQPKTRV